MNTLPGMSNLILAGGDWDNVLISYCQGKRNQPVWAIGQAEYRGKGRMDIIQNIFFLSKFNVESLRYALRHGMLYIRYYSENIDIFLSDFYIEDSQKQAEGKIAFMGDEIEIRGKPCLRIKGSYMIKPPEDLKIEIIRDGEIIQRFEFSNEKVFDLEFQDDSLPVLHRKSYYRLNFFTGDKIILVTNPVFVEVENGY